MPITEQVVQVLHHGKPAASVASAFMARDTKPENLLA
jgi:glycerol-3-phosphate dehydrogenase